MDIAFIGGSNVCGSGGGYECYDAGTTDQPYAGPPYPGTGITTGAALGTNRILLSYDRAFTANIMAGVRIGYALFGGPPAVTDNKQDQDPKNDETIAFLPFHAELRVSYYFGQGALAKKGLRPYVFAGGGMAQVDVKVPVTVFDCSQPTFKATPSTRPTASQGKPIAGPMGQDQSKLLSQRKLDAWKKLGQGFVAGGGGLVFAFTKTSAPS